LLTEGTADEVIARTRLTTWSVSGPDLRGIMAHFRRHPVVEQAVVFGNTIHLSGADAEALELAIAPFRTGEREWRQIEPSLEDVFIHLMNNANGGATR
ncbi:MAG: hypothetical protein AAGU11_07425, partial [Syntrophobacteraceae bacterium]